MNSMEVSKIDQRVENLEQRFEEKYGTPFLVWKRKCFFVNEQEFFRVSGLKWLNAIVIEHAFSEEEAKKNMFEDGDIFYMDEFAEDEMLDAMIREIEDIE